MIRLWANRDKGHCRSHLMASPIPEDLSAYQLSCINQQAFVAVCPTAPSVPCVQPSFNLKMRFWLEPKHMAQMQVWSRLHKSLHQPTQIVFFEIGCRIRSVLVSTVSLQPSGVALKVKKWPNKTWAALPWQKDSVLEASTQNWTGKT